MNQNQFKSQDLFKIMMIILIFILAVVGCKNSSESSETETTESLPEEKNIVETITLKDQDFMQEIVSNGKLSAFQRAELYFEVPGFIDQINVRNGLSIEKGIELANLQNDDYQFNLRKAEISKETAEIEKLDVLLGMGYAKDEKNIAPEHEKIANIRSGYHQAQVQYDEAKRQLEHSYLKAPFSGTIEGVFQRAFEKADLSKPFCTLLNDEKFIIRFPLLETEISKVNEGQKVGITSIAGGLPCTGTITEINPSIDENGLAWLKAEVKNPGGYMEGMNVKVSIKKAIPSQLVVPKNAVVLRQNREVLFRYTNGISYWTYVNVLDENEHQYSVVAADGATLELGDTVIISNNLNLAHESEVEIK